MSTAVVNSDLDGGAVASGMSHLVATDQIDVSHGVVLYLDSVSVSFDGFAGLPKSFRAEAAFTSTML